MQITFNLPHVFEAGSNPVDNARALRVMLDCMVALNREYLKRYACRPIYKAGVVYGRTTLWEPIPAILTRGYGDCKSLAPWFIAQCHQNGIPARPVFRWLKRPDGARDFHILVQTPDGFTDPSRVLGMGANENARY